MHVIGTSGHVDHGKTTLISKLTGINPDRLKEEQEREMTIDLGFAWLTLPDGKEIGIVDVPGHRDFIGNMLAGVGGIDGVMLIIAADEGVMPQTREHLAILDLLGINKGIIVLTKIDLVEDPDWFELIETEIRNVLQPTGLRSAPIVRVSSLTRAGFPDLLSELSKLIQNCPQKTDLDRPRLPIDRVFPMTGFGTVVTGTLLDGRMESGDEVEIFPSRLRGKIRGLQTHKKEMGTAFAGSRTAINISGLDWEQIHRGNVVTHPGQYQGTQRLDVRFRSLPDASRPLRHNAEVKLYHYTSEISALVRTLDANEVLPGEEKWLQLELREPIVSARGDRFILRNPSPGETIGGGMVVEPLPKGRHKRFDTDILASLGALLRGTPADVLLESSLALGFARITDVITHSRLEEAVSQPAIQELVARGQIIQIENYLCAASQWEALRKKAADGLSTYHHTNPLRSSMPREELRERLGIPTPLFNVFIKRSAADGMLIDLGSSVKLTEHQIALTPEQSIATRLLLNKFAQAPYTPPAIKECQAEVGKEVFQAMIEKGELMAVSSEIAFRTEDYNAMVEKIKEELRARGKLSLAEVRDLFNSSRRYIQPLLEYLDSQGVTRREGDFRVAR
jgi:selenocysteine-specific elongation factor